jgi:sulfatase maturation enzyme AslB (radical SAM superfamily)
MFISNNLMPTSLLPALESQSSSPEVEFASSFEGPRSLDLLLTARCQLSCPFCFAPQEEFLEISKFEWKRLIYLSSLMHTQNIIFTGGEPLLVPFLPELITYARNQGQVTTLSTNALLLAKRYKEIMPYLNEVGIPIDGCNPVTNALLRQPEGEEQFLKAVNAIKFIIRDYPQVELTIRTVVSAINIAHILKMPVALSRQGIDMTKVRWKLYQFNALGEQFDYSQMEQLGISTSSFLALRTSLEKIDAHVEFFPALAQDSNYSIVYPNGNLVTAVPDIERPYPYDFPFFKNLVFGNLSSDFVSTMTAWRKWRKSEKNKNEWMRFSQEGISVNNTAGF